MFDESNVIVLARCNREQKVEKNRQRSPDACVKQVLTVRTSNAHTCGTVGTLLFFYLKIIALRVGNDSAVRTKPRKAREKITWLSVFETNPETVLAFKCLRYCMA